MTPVVCGGCGRTLVATPAHAGLTLRCETCGSLVRVPDAPARIDDNQPGGSAREAGAPPRSVGPDPRRATSGDVPAPMASGSDAGATLALALAGASLILPPLGPIALWLATTAARRIESRGGDEPTTIRHARFLAIVGTVLLGLLAVCGIPFVLVLG